MSKQLYRGMAFVILVVALLTACGVPDDLAPLPSGTVPAPAPTSTSTPLPTDSTIALPTQTPAPRVLPTLISPSALTLTPTATPTTIPAETPAASFTPKVELSSPMIVDSEGGRLYIHATMGGVQQIVALSAADGRLLTAYGVAGPFAVDGVHGWLYVDRAETGLAVLDTQTGLPHAVIALPEARNEGREEHLSRVGFLQGGRWQ